MLSEIIYIILLILIITLIWFPNYVLNISNDYLLYIKLALTVSILLSMFFRNVYIMTLFIILLTIIIYFEYKESERVKTLKEVEIEQKRDEKNKTDVQDAAQSKLKLKNINENEYIGEIEVERNLDEEGAISRGFLNYTMIDNPLKENLNETISELIK